MINYRMLSDEFLKAILRLIDLKSTTRLPWQRPDSEIKAEIEEILRERNQ